MDDKSREWQSRFEKVWDPNGEGQYRLGSPGQRLAKRFVNHVEPKMTINEYGSGTGRAVVEIMRQPGHCDHPINMVDIARNALEPGCKWRLEEEGSLLTFTNASLWNLPPDFPHAEWGYCVDVLMCLPPEKLDAVLSEICRTCDNLFVQVYDWADVRCGIDLTTIKGDSAWWKNKLSEYWHDVTQEISPESSHRYIYVCNRKKTGISLAATNEQTISALKGKYKGQTAWIVGRGASLLQVAPSDFGAGPVIVLNEAIMNINPLNLPNDIYSLWRNGDAPKDLLKYMPKNGTLLLCDNPVLNDPPSSTLFADYPARYTFECLRDLKCSPPATFSQKAALEIAVQIFGCDDVAWISFDSCTTGDVRTVLMSDFIQSEHKPGAYNEQCELTFIRIKELGIKSRWITPGAGSIIKDNRVRINVGCGEVVMPGYVNIDLHHEFADLKMDALHLQYGDATVDEVRSSHLLEHFSKREAPLALREWFRVLKVGGALLMDIPNLEWCVKNWLDKDETAKFGISLDMIFGLQHHDGEYHKTGFTKPRLMRLLVDAGFEDIQIDDRWSHDQQCYQVTAVKKKEIDRITVITCTGDRPLAFALCKRWMRNQIRQPDQWLVIDDGKNPLSPTPDMEYVRRDPRPDDPKHTMLLNIQKALPLITGNKIIFMEDDEYYGPRYVYEMARRLDNYEAVGIARSKYYHLPTGGFLRHSNMDHASLAQTAIKSTFLPELKPMLESNDMYLDIRIWKKIGNTDKLKWGEEEFIDGKREVGNKRGKLFDDGDGHDGGCLYVGIKGLPGRPGIGCGHRDYSEYLPDTKNRETLRRWIPKDCQIYLDIITGKLREDNIETING